MSLSRSGPRDRRPSRELRLEPERGLRFRDIFLGGPAPRCAGACLGSTPPGDTIIDRGQPPDLSQWRKTERRAGGRYSRGYASTLSDGDRNCFLWKGCQVATSKRVLMGVCVE